VQNALTDLTPKKARAFVDEASQLTPQVFKERYGEPSHTMSTIMDNVRQERRQNQVAQPHPRIEKTEDNVPAAAQEQATRQGGLIPRVKLAPAPWERELSQTVQNIDDGTILNVVRNPFEKAEPELKETIRQYNMRSQNWYMRTRLEQTAQPAGTLAELYARSRGIPAGSDEQTH
jgi:hypothetical protein